MSEDNVAVVIGRAVTDKAFREQLLSNPETALKDYDLTPEERESLLNIKRDAIEAFERNLDDRIIKSKMW